MTLPISTDKIVGGSGVGGSIIAIILIIYMSGGDITSSSEFVELDKNFEVHAASPGHSTALQNHENLKNDIDELEDDIKDEFKTVNEKLDTNYRLLCQISNGNCK